MFTFKSQSEEEKDKIKAFEKKLADLINDIPENFPLHIKDMLRNIHITVRLEITEGWSTKND